MRDQGTNIYKINLSSFLACIIMTFIRMYWLLKQLTISPN